MCLTAVFKLLCNKALDIGISPTYSAFCVFWHDITRRNDSKTTSTIDMLSMAERIFNCFHLSKKH